MTGCQQDKYDDTHYDSIPAKGFKAVFCEESYKPFHGKYGHDKGDTTAQEQHFDVMSGGPCRVFLEHFEQIEQGCAGHSWHCQEERELCRTVTGQLLLHSSHDSRHATAQDRKSTRLNSSHANISYAVFCLKKKKYNSI